MKNNVEKSYGIALSTKQLKFLVNCIDIAQDSHSIHPDKEETDLIRRLGKKYDDIMYDGLEDQEDFHYKLK
tara:strand:- start:538 stop:750 length:213 start_codon:yes stop_codon:yes gene_type:complete